MNAPIFPIPAYGTEAYRLWRKRLALHAQEEQRRLEHEAIVRRITESVPSQAEVERSLQKHRATTIIEEVAKEFGLTVADIKSDVRRPLIAQPRQKCYYRLYEETRLSLVDIGKKLNRNNASIVHGIRAHAKRNGLPFVTRTMTVRIEKPEKPKVFRNVDRAYELLRRSGSTPIPARTIEHEIFASDAKRLDKTHDVIKALRKRGVIILAIAGGYVLEEFL